MGILCWCLHIAACNNEEEGGTTVNDGSTAAGDTTITVTDGTQLNVGDIDYFST